MHINPFQDRQQYSFQSADEADDFEDTIQGNNLASNPAQIASHERRHLDDIIIMRWIEVVARASGEVPATLAAYAGVASATFFRKAGEFYTTTILMWVDEQDRSYLKRHEPLEAMYFLVRQMHTDGSVVTQDFGVSTLTELSDQEVDDLYSLALTLANGHNAARG